MPHSFEEVRQIAHELPDDQRILLANDLYESVEDDQEETTEIEATWADEIDRRLAGIDSGAVKTIPLEEMLARMDARILARRRG
jgi:putative addiction module component (TIGR02574 family)